MEVTERARRRGVDVVVIVGACIAAAASPERQRLRHYDHVAYLETHRLVRAGEDLYEASIAGLAYIGANVDQARAVRQPWVFAVWSLLPQDAWRFAFFVVVVMGGALVCARVARHPEIGIAVGVYLALAGVYGDVDAWALFELWAAPLILTSALLWVRGRDTVAAIAVLGAMLLRETIVLLALGYLVASWRQRRDVRPWLAAIALAAGALLLHWLWVEPHLDPSGRSATLAGTGSLSAFVETTRFIALADFGGLGLVLWVVGVVLLWRSALRPTVALALIPLLSLEFNRPYWGWLAMPLCILALGGLPPYPISREPADGPSRTRRQRPSRAATTAP